jgi:uncharacterized repeat protein (TIGR03806 family)
VVSVALFAGTTCGVHGAESEAASKPFGIDHRIPWVTSRVIGSPDPPPPYRVQRAFPRLTFQQPLCVTYEPGTDNLLVIQHRGGYEGPAQILRFKNQADAAKTDLLLQVDRIVYGIAFHPDFLKNGYIYLGSNGPDGGTVKKDRVSRFTIERKPPYRCDAKSELVILEWPSNGHNGADLAFGRDGYLYISSGDGTSDSDTDLRGQEQAHLTSKVLRIDVNKPDGDKPYSVPKDNPFVNRKGTRPETWAYGFRNPWRLTFDRETGHLWVAQNGQDLWEQAFLVQRGGNYGWSVYEGSHPFQLHRERGPDPILPPTVEHHHSQARSLTGGIVYYGSRLAELRGGYIYGDYSTGKIWGIRHDGSRILWHKELANTRLQIVGFGADQQGELFVVDHLGGLYTLVPTPRDVRQSRFPRRLSETGLFLSVKDHRPQPGLIPYSVNAPLWSDGATKERFIGLPGTSQIEFTDSRGWNFSDGAVLVKTFSLDRAEPEALATRRDRPSRRRIETRLLTRQEGEWVGYSYIWNEEQTDADLVGAAGQDRTFTLHDAQAPGGQRRLTWHYPSRAECMVCHSRAANWVLGLTVLQMNKTHDYGRIADNQLRTLEHLGVFRSTEKEQGHKAQGGPQPPAARLPKRPEQYSRLVNPYDPKEDLNARARSYLHANCSQCHVEAGGGNALMELELTTERNKAHLFGVRPQHDTYGMADAQLIAPGHPERSVLLRRMALRGPGQMPPLATSVVDQEAVKLVREWIAQLKPDSR